ncbi:MAG: sensor histidine kinase [Candidatus Hodarchaeales archaeon]|jgi:signal transduction histidine kinase
MRLKSICAELNNFTELEPTLISVINNIKELTGIESISIRLHDQGDYPYYVHDGFSDKFIRKENSLCSKDSKGRRIPAPDGKGYLLDCMCGNIISGNYDSKQTFFTEKGSFWSNSTSHLLATTTDDTRQGRTRNYCNAVGYESVALIPIKAMGERIGLIQLNDFKKGMFSESLVFYLEMIGEQVGLAVKNSLAYTKLIELNKMKDNFLSIISHDIRSPFATLTMLIEYLNENLDKFDKEQLKSEINTIDNSSKRIFAFIDELLTWSSIQKKTTVYVRQEYNLRSLVDEVADLYSESAKEKGIALNIYISDDITIYSDSNAVKTVLRNLVSNAIKFTDNGDEINVTGKKERHFTEITVSDTGIGMDEKSLTSLFDLSTKNKKHGTKDERGTGLGLVICNELIKRLEGDIHVESELGKGSSFTVSIPS